MKATPVLLTISAYLVCAWIIALAGLSAVQNSETSNGVSYTLSLQWFILFLELLVIFMLPVLAVTGRLRKFSSFVVANMTMVSTLLALFAYYSYLAVRGSAFAGWPGSTASTGRNNVWIAGCSLLIIGNVLVMLGLSLDMDDDKEIMTQRRNDAPATPTKAPAPAPESKPAPPPVAETV